MYKKADPDKNTQEVRVFVKPSDKKAIQELADEWGVSMGTVMKIGFINLKRQLNYNTPILQPSEELADSLQESYNPGNVKRFKGSSVDELLKELDD